MRLRVDLLSILLLVSAELAADTVQGYVLNPISETRIADIEVVFFIEQDGQLSEILRRRTDVEGRFAFSGPFLTPGLSCVLAATYKDALYPTVALEVGTFSQVIVEVYEPTTSDAQIRIATYDLVISLEAQNLSVGHLVQMENPDDSTYVGSGQGPERRATEFALPDGLFNLRDQGGSLKRGDSGRFYDNRPLPPGFSQIGFSFDLDPHQLDGGYSHKAVYDTEVLSVLLQPGDIAVEPPFEDLGEVAFHDQKYRRLRLTGLRAGQSALIPLPLNRPVRWLLKWVALGGALLCVLLLLAIGRLSSDPIASDEAVDLCRQRDEVVGQLARLDDAYSERPDERGYLNERTRFMDRALALYLLLEERDERQ